MDKFASFNWPKRPWTLPKGSAEQRAKALKDPKTWINLCSNPLYRTFYWSKSGIPDLDWSYADTILGKRKRAYYADDWSGAEFRGIVFTLPNRRGFLPGYTDGFFGRADYDIYSDQRDAAISSDYIARAACEREVEYQEQLSLEEEQLRLQEEQYET